MSMDKPGYEMLGDVLQAAFDQAAYGKGADRHACGNAFEDQRMQTISDLLDSPNGMVYQVIKKMTEGLDMPEFERREKELLGAIVYLAGIVVWHRRKHEELITKGYLPEPRLAPAPPVMPASHFKSCKVCGAIGGHGDLACPWGSPAPAPTMPSTQKAYSDAVASADLRDQLMPRCMVCNHSPCECTGVGLK